MFGVDEANVRNTELNLDDKTTHERLETSGTFANVEAMLEASKQDARVLAKLDPSLLKDRQFLEMMPPSAFPCVPQEALGRFPDLASNAIGWLGRNQERLKVNGVALHFLPVLVDDRNLQLKWFEAGLPLSVKYFPNSGQKTRNYFFSLPSTALVALEEESLL